MNRLSDPPQPNRRQKRASSFGHSISCSFRVHPFGFSFSQSPKTSSWHSGEVCRLGQLEMERVVLVHANIHNYFQAKDVAV